MADENPTNDLPHDDALAALHGKHEPHEEHHEEVAEVAEEHGASPSGFVGILAKGNPPEEPAPARPVPTTPSSRPKPQPRNETEPAAASPRTAGTEQIRMAKEIVMPTAEELVEPEPAPAPAAPVKKTQQRSSGRKRKVPGWYHAAVPVMFTCSSFLLFIGFWALGAVGYIMFAAPKFREDIHYPLIRWDDNVGDIGGISAGSKMMAWFMLISLPVAISLIVMAIIMQKQIRAVARAAAARQQQLEEQEQQEQQDQQGES